MIALHPLGSLPAAPDRLRAVGAQLRPFEADRIPRLTADTESHFCLIPEASFRSPDWPKLRSQLGRAGRFFVVEFNRPATCDLVAAMRDGAFEVLATADTVERWQTALDHVVRSQELWVKLYAGRFDPENVRLIGRSLVMQELRRDLERLGPTDVSVLLLGESGAGKERVTAALHEAGSGGPLVSLNCAAMPKDLIEAELFGAEKGSFTGALKTRMGLVEQAAGGTLFLDEVGELDIALQPKLLRFLETRRARRIGGEKEYSVKVRVVSATNRDLQAEIRAGRFRSDLYFRLAEVVLNIAPLRDRLEDIPDLTRVFIDGANERFGKNIEAPEPALVGKLKKYHWPGNVRELKSVIDRLVLFHDGPLLREGWWEPPMVLADPVVTPPPAAPVAAPVAAPPPAVGSGPGYPAHPGGLGSRTDRLDLARQLLQEGRLSLAEVAARTGIHPTTLFRWRKSGKV
jgi:DNA-binding NtrC family response regulator